jgi:phage virion morphogenesis protein
MSGGIRLEITLDDRQARDALTRLAARISNLTPVMKVIGETVRSSVLKNFEAGGRPPWIPTKPLSVFLSRKIAGKDVTSRRGQASLLKRQQGKATLIDSGRLRKSITVEAGSQEVAVGSNLVYARIHQLGGKAGRGRKVTIPARPYLAVQPEDHTEIGRLLVDYLRRAVQ